LSISVIDIKYINKQLVGIGQCNTCQKVDNSSVFKTKTECTSCYNKRYRASNKEYLKIQKNRRSRPEVKAKSAISHKKYKIKNKEKIRLAKNDYRKRNPLSRKGESQFRKNAIKNQTISKRFKEQIVNIYKTCPDNMQVDHIIPLLNKDVCGLHVPWNLQFLDKEVNNLKNNKWDGTYNNTNWSVT